ncbi:S1C family serine protease [Methylacidimicrobium cyclopophantes]|uniref:S1C family serine protease n=1 Tax=Methylacidimicrobium cyclopophantes TaxID=1041766 RepID=UPI0015B445BC|nr:S1C family serine protease [Methylacidimicrobium cyclopophantes]
MTFKLSISAVTILLFLSSATSGSAWQDSFITLSSEVRRVFGAAHPAVVRVRARQDSAETVGSGFFIDRVGTVVTLAELVGQAREIQVESKTGTLPAVLVGQDGRSGLAILRTRPTQPTPFLRFASGSEAVPGSFLVGVGYPFNLSASPIVALVLGMDRQFQDRLFCVSHLRVDVTVSPGELGAPLLNSKGLVVGVITMVVNEGKWAYALPGRAAERVIADVRQYGRVRYAWAGVGVARVSNDPGGSAVVITRLFPNSSATASGLQEGDRLERINGKPVHHLADVVDASFYAPVGRPMTILVSRDGKTKAFSLLAGERPLDSPGETPGASPVTAETSRTRSSGEAPVQKVMRAGPN